MANFPALEPNARSYNFGLLPLTEEPSISAGIVRFKHSNLAQNLSLTLGYQALTEEKINLIRQHFQNQAGSYRSFHLPSVVWKGHTFSANIAPYRMRWRYAEPPQEEHLVTGHVDVTVVLISDGTSTEEIGFQDVNVTLTGGSASA